MSRGLASARGKGASNTFVPFSLRPASTGILQRKCGCGQHTGSGECEECMKKKEKSSGDPLLQRSSLNRGSVNVVPPIVHDVLRSPGQPLDATTRAFFEPRFGASIHRTPVRLSSKVDGGGLSIEPANSSYEREADAWADRINSGPIGGPLKQMHNFSQVRVHVDAQAAESAQRVNARAYTVGSHIVFGKNQFDPGSTSGQRLLAHELTHVLQQSGAAPQAVYRDELKVGSDVTDECEGSEDISDKVKAFVKDMPNVVKKIADLGEGAKRGYVERFNAVMTPEGDVDLTKFKFLKCDKIHLEVDPTTSFEAFSDKSHKTIGFGKAVAARIEDSQKPSDIPEYQKDSLEKILTTLAHEKRHMTIKDAPKIGVGDLKRGDSQSTATREQYHAEEILVIAEELVQARLAEGDTYLVPDNIPRHIHRLRNLIRNFVTEDALKRVRQGIIDSLRKRYPSGKCDSAIILGMVSAMDFGRWHECNKSTGELELNVKIPEGLNLCPVKGNICKVKTPGGEKK